MPNRIESKMQMEMKTKIILQIKMHLTLQSEVHLKIQMKILLIYFFSWGALTHNLHKLAQFRHHEGRTYHSFKKIILDFLPPLNSNTIEALFNSLKVPLMVL
jgi:hypothetical protein